MALHNDWPISDRYWAISRQKHETFFDWLQFIVSKILVLNTPLKTNILLKCSLTLTILIIWISESAFLLFYCFNLFVISFIRQLFICVWYQWGPRWNFRVLSTAPITEPPFDETAGICPIVAVVDTRRVLRARKPLRGECSPEPALMAIDLGFYHQP
jgi:hypothetical protein